MKWIICILMMSSFKTWADSYYCEQVTSTFGTQSYSLAIVDLGRGTLSTIAQSGVDHSEITGDSVSAVFKDLRFDRAANCKSSRVLSDTGDSGFDFACSITAEDGETYYLNSSLRYNSDRDVGSYNLILTAGLATRGITIDFSGCR